MAKWFFLLLTVLSAALSAVENRFALERPDSATPLVYYFTAPSVSSYPILVLCEGSSSEGDLGSVLYIRNFFAPRIEALQFGFLTVEKWGVDGEEIDEEEFWPHYTRSQRLADHLQVLAYFTQNPPEGWNGKFLFVGVSEGGPLVTDLSILCDNTLATINWVGAGHWSWADELYHFFERFPHLLTDVPKERGQFDLLVEQISQNPTPYKRLGGMTYLYHADAFAKPPIDYTKIHAPFLVVIGTEDNLIDSCDQFVELARKAGAPITYFRIEGMDHWIRHRPDVIDRSFAWLLQ